MKTTFEYKRSYRVIYWGCCFDSLLELKFAVSIAEDYEFLHARISVYYDLKTKRPTGYIREYTRRYTPDFLIRHKITGEAFWVEIKPKGFDDHDQLALRRQVAENYISWKNYDWKYKVVFGDEIKLTQQQVEAFIGLCRLRSKSEFKIYMNKLNVRYNSAAPPLFCGSVSNKNTAYIMFGSNNCWKKKAV